MGDFENFILYWLASYKIPATFIGSFFFGETVILTAAILAFRFDWSVTAIFITAVAGTVISDLIWYGFGKKMLDASRAKSSGLAKRYEKHVEAVSRAISIKRPFTILLYFKFFYGTRIITLIYLSVHKMKLKELVIFDTIGTVVYHAVLFVLAFLSAAGVYGVLDKFHEYTLMLTSVVVSLLIIKAVTVWITKKIEKK